MSGFFRVRNIVLFLPCIAVFIGLNLFGSAWAAILFYHAIIVICLFLTRRSHPRPELFRGWNTPVGAGLTLLCASAGPALLLLWPLIESTQGGLAPALETFGLRGAGWYLFAVYFVSLHPVLEELFWRGVMAPKNRSVDIVDIAFGAYHALVLVHFLKLPWVILVFVLLVLVSWFWRRIAERYAGLAIPLVSHMTAGAGIMAAAYFLIN